MTTNTEAWWIGDLCYVMGDVWDEVCNATSPDPTTEVTGSLKLQDGREFVIYGTAYGDGVYLDQYGNEYGVDAGVIGAIRLTDIHDPEANVGLGHIHDMEAPVTEHHSYCQGLITLGTIQIETDSEYYEEEEYEDDYEGDEPYEGR